MTKEEALLEFFHRVIDWSERTQSDVLSTFDVPDEVWEPLRDLANEGPND
jgi:hypothetical protein